MFRPWLEVKLNQSFPDPSQFSGEKEFLYAALTASLFKKVIVEMLQYVDSQKDIKEALDKKLKNKVTKQFNIGG